MRARAIDELERPLRRGRRRGARDDPLRAAAPALARPRRVLRDGRRADRPGGAQRARARPRRDAGASGSRRTCRRRSSTRCASSPPPCARSPTRSRTRAGVAPCASPRCAPPPGDRGCSRAPATCRSRVIVGQIRSTATDLLARHRDVHDEAADAVRRRGGRGEAVHRRRDGGQRPAAAVSRPGRPGTRTSSGRRPSPARARVPQRGQRPPRTRCGIRRPVWTPPLRIASRGRGAERRGAARRAPRPTGRRPGAAGAAARATGSRPRAGCRRRRSRPGRAAAP